MYDRYALLLWQENGPIARRKWWFVVLFITIVQRVRQCLWWKHKSIGANSFP
jgi:hypothetical protein